MEERRPVEAAIRIASATTAEEIGQVRILFQEYADALGVDLEYQGFHRELDELPGDYAAPGGCLLLATRERSAAGCVGVRPFGPGIAEMKRLYVRPAARGLGLGRVLAERAIRFAAAAGYASMRLDTLPQMREAQELYGRLGFAPIDAYRYSPVPGTRFMELALIRA